MNIADKIKELDGPILILGATGFIGSNLLRTILKVRGDVYGTFFSGANWRLEGIPAGNILFFNIEDPHSHQLVLNKLKPKTIFNCIAFGAYSFESNISRIHETNYLNFINLLESIRKFKISAFINAGSSSEYGNNSNSPKESTFSLPNSHYSISKLAASQAISYFGKVIGMPVLNLRLYSVYGPYEDGSRLIPLLAKNIISGKLPTFASKNVSRDFVYIDDVVEAFVNSAIFIKKEFYGDSFNIGTDVSTSLGQIATISKNIFHIKSKPVFNSKNGRKWDRDDWKGNSLKSKKLINWKHKVDLDKGLIKTVEWWSDFLKNNIFESLTKKEQINISKNSLSVVIACYKDELAIPIMYKRLKKVFQKLHMDHEIIFVNDCSPDNSEAIIQKLSSIDPNVIGITHSRNFGSQAAFMSGMELSSKAGVVIMDGDLQDPPELIEDFVREWQKGYDVVLGNRTKREESFIMEFFFKAFYRLFSFLSDFKIPVDVGDFSLIDQKVRHWILECKEKDLFLRGIRAYVGFKQGFVNYVRPKRKFGRSTNNMIKNIGWAKKAIFSYSKIPLHFLTFIGVITLILTIMLASYTLFFRLYDSNSVPRGLTFISLIIMFFGSITIFGIGVLGEYISKIFDETKDRPLFIRTRIISNGKFKQPTS